MEILEFSRLERIARNLPCWPGTLNLGRVDTDLGPIYIALGRGYSSEPDLKPVCWHGVYAIHYGAIKGMCRPAQVQGHLSLRQAQEVLALDALWYLEMLASRDMNDESFSLAGPKHALRFGA